MGSAQVEEFWTAPRAGTLLGMSRTIRGDSTVGHEIMLIEVRDGRLVLNATPAGQGTTSFESRGATGTSVAFSNASHDFPQRIRYRYAPPDSLLAWLDGPPGPESRTIAIPMRRSQCPESPR